MSTNKEEKKIYPEDVNFEPVQMTLYKGPDGVLYHELKLDIARHLNCTVTKCQVCKKNDTQFKGRICEECLNEKSMKEYRALTKTTEDYPCIIDDRYFFNKEELAEYLEENELNPDNLIIHGCYRRPPHELEEEYWEEHMTEDGELPGNLEQLISEFNTKLALIPGLWWEDVNTRFIYNPLN